MELIRSAQNPLIKETAKLMQRKQREERGQFLVEGVRLTEEACRWGRVESAFYSPEMLDSQRGQELLLMLEKTGAKICQVSAEVLRKLSETDSPQGVIVIVQKREYTLDMLATEESSILLICDGVQDPGNLGTMIRTAWGAGATAVVCLPGTVDPYGGKTVRSSMGGIFRVPLITGVTWEKTLKWCRAQGYQVVAGDPAAGEIYHGVQYPSRAALVIGNEGRGFISVNPAEADLRIRIPLHNGADSLNAAVAAGILLYEISCSREEQVHPQKVSVRCRRSMHQADMNL